MEIIIIVAILALALSWFFLREDPAKIEAPAPYKVETPPAADPAPASVVEVKVEEPAPAPVVEERAAPRLDPVAIALDMTPVVMTAKKPRKPRAPKVVAPVAKPVVKKAAPVKKAAAIKAAPKKPVSPRSKKA
jgi:hypothetical protein